MFSVNSFGLSRALSKEPCCCSAIQPPVFCTNIHDSPAQISFFLRKNIHEPPEYISFLSYLQNLILLPYIIQSKIFTGVYSNSKNKWEFTLFRYSDKGQIGYIFNIISNSEIYNKACANEFFKLSPKLPNEIHRKILQVFLLATKNSSKSDS